MVRIHIALQDLPQSCCQTLPPFSASSSNGMQLVLLVEMEPYKVESGTQCFLEMQVACPPVSGPVPQKVCILLKNALWLTLLAIYFKVYNCDSYFCYFYFLFLLCFVKICIQSHNLYFNHDPNHVGPGHSAFLWLSKKWRDLPSLALQHLGDLMNMPC